jgi:Lipocalin-like domain
MQISKLKLIGVVFGFAVLGSPAQSAENFKVAGLWRIVAFHTEDIATKAQNRLYGERPMGFMKLETDGRLSAWLASDWPSQSAQSVSEDAALSFASQRSAYRAVFYSGRYRLNENEFLVNIDQAQHEGWVGVESFDLTWTEGRTLKEETRSFRIETDRQEREILRIETAPMRNPNGAENTIIGRLIWTRVSDWEFGD